MRSLTEDEWQTVCNALQTAARVFDECAEQSDEMEQSGGERLAEQFRRQSEQSRDLVALLGEEMGIV